jgi:Uma2 family endonuclease
MVSTARARGADPTVYPVEERVGEDIIQRWIVELFRPLLERWLGERGQRAFVGADQFIYWKQHDPHKRVAPDVYVLPGVDPTTHVPSWKIWETGISPSFALEVVSKDWEKDYAQAPTAYEPTGVRELVLFDPMYETRAEGLLFQVYRRTARRGLVRVDVTNGDRIRSKVLGCWLRSVGTERMIRLRIGSGPAGNELFPTAEEQERAEKDRERAEKDRERAEKEGLLTKVAAMEQELARLKAKGRTGRR